MNHIRRRKRERSGIRDDDGPIRCQAHLQWVRGHECAIAGRSPFFPEDKSLRKHLHMPHRCEGRIESAHVRIGSDGGVALKPSDSLTIPLCTKAHGEQHNIGEPAFERRYSIRMKEIAELLWQQSPAGKRYRREREE